MIGGRIAGAVFNVIKYSIGLPQTLKSWASVDGHRHRRVGNRLRASQMTGGYKW